jgi:glycerophosphoryl diester phosphodiesterase
MAHRGGAGLRPENTITAFENAVGLGVDVLELDIHRSLDGHLVVIHDADVARTTNGGGLVAAMTLAELQQLDAGYNWRDSDGNFPYRNSGLIIPTLAEVFERFSGSLINVEIKPPQIEIVAELWRLIGDHDMADRVLVASQHHNVIDSYRNLAPGAITSASRREVRCCYISSRLGAPLERCGAAYALQIPRRHGLISLANRRLIDAAHRAKKEVHVWTIDQERQMKRLLGCGVDGLITNHPDRLLKLLGRL